MSNQPATCATTLGPAAASQSRAPRIWAATFAIDLIPWPLSGRQQTVLVRPVELLHHLGQITTPPITELVDLSSTWAEIRYVWAFRPNFGGRFRRALRLNDAVKRLDFHQKTLLSDEFGVAFAAYYMDRFEQATDPVDVFVAKRQGQFRLRGNSRRSLPDYIFTGPGQDRSFIVECKGTQSRARREPAAARVRAGADGRHRTACQRHAACYWRMVAAEHFGLADRP